MYSQQMFNEYDQSTGNRLSPCLMPLMDGVGVPPSSARVARSASHRSASSSEAPRGTCGHPSGKYVSTFPLPQARQEGQCYIQTRRD